MFQKKEQIMTSYTNEASMWAEWLWR